MLTTLTRLDHRRGALNHELKICFISLYISDSVVLNILRGASPSWHRNDARKA